MNPRKAIRGMAQRLLADFPLQELAKETGFRERIAPAGWRALYARGGIRARDGGIM